MRQLDDQRYAHGRSSLDDVSSVEGSSGLEIMRHCRIQTLMHSVLTTPTFERQAKAAKLDEDAIQRIIAFLAANPKSGVLMRATGGARKVRFEGNEGGKSGGFRTIHYFGGDDVPVFLLGLIDKAGKQENLTAAQKKALAETLPRIADAYRAAGRKTAEMSRNGER